MSLPAAKAILDLASLNSLLAIRSPSITPEFSLLGTSIPTAAFPGIGASILMSAAARLSFISSARETILLTLTPCSGCNSYLVTAGPRLTSVIVTLTPNVASVCCNLPAVALSSSLPSFPLGFPLLLFKRLTGGSLYLLFLAVCDGFTGNACACSVTLP